MTRSVKFNSKKEKLTRSLSHDRGWTPPTPKEQ